MTGTSYEPAGESVRCPFCGDLIDGSVYVLHSERHDDQGDQPLPKDPGAGSQP